MPEINIGFDETEKEYTIYVSDNGIGIEEKDHATVFEMFARLKEKDVEGSGIGLATVKKIVEDNGGRIWLESEKGKGTTFYLTILKNF